MNRMTHIEVRAARNQLGLTLEQIATLLHTNGRTWHRYEADPILSTARRIPGPTQAALEWLVAGKLPPMPRR